MVTKCDWIETALTYLRLEKTSARDVERIEEIRHAQERVDRWRKVYRADKARAAAVRTSVESEKEWDLSTLTEILRCAQMWQDFDECVEDSQGSRLEDDRLKTCTSVV